MMSKDIVRNILSDYIEYDYLSELLNSDEYKFLKDLGFNLNPNRIQVKEQFYPDGTPNIKNTYKDSIIIKKEKWCKNGVKITENNYKNGKFDGKQYYWYDIGVKKFEHNFIDGKTEGSQYAWYSNGNIKYEENYKNGEYEGKQCQWYETDENKKQLVSEQNYKNGLKDGWQYHWDSTGEFTKEERYVNGDVLESIPHLSLWDKVIGKIII